jgi:hypothetical protein
VTVLKKGDHYDTEGEPFPCDIIYERDVPVTLADGTVIDVDIFRPITDEKVPCIMAWHAFGKTLLPDASRPDPEFLKMLGPDGAAMFAAMNGDAKLSGLETRQGPDPADWVNHGYAVCSPDPRGVYHSQGNMQYFGRQYGKDGAEVVDFLGTQDWCNGKVGLTGTHWSAISAWFIAAEQPKHLSAMFIVEGHGRFYEDEMMRGGIPALDFGNRNRSFGYNKIEDIAGMGEKYPLYNEYWADKDAHFEKVTCPIFAIPSFWQSYHSRSVFNGFNEAPSTQKWMRVHNGMKANPYRLMAHQNESREFFDYFLKGLDNGWDKKPKVRLGLLDPGHEDISDRIVDAFPPSGYTPTTFYLNGETMGLDTDASKVETTVSYIADDGVSGVRFGFKAKEDFELVGYSKIKLWVEADGSDDMDIFVNVDKLSADGEILIAKGTEHNTDYAGPNSRLRVSHRHTDPEKSTELEPYHTHDREELLNPGEIVPVELGIWPTAMVFHKGEQLTVEITGHALKVRHQPNNGNIATRNNGRHIIHTGGKYDSKIILPIK